MHSQVRKRALRLFGFVPRLLTSIGADEPVADIYLHALERLQHSALTRPEREVAMLTASVELGCDACIAFDLHQGVLARVPTPDLERIVAKLHPADARLRAVNTATRMLVETKGRLTAEQWRELDGLGIERTQLCTMISLIAMKVLSNYATYVLGVAHDDPQPLDRKQS